MFHNGANPSHVVIALFRFPATAVVLINSNQVGPGTAAAAGTPIALPRPIIVPPGWSLSFAAQVLAAGESVFGRVLYQRRKA